MSLRRAAFSAARWTSVTMVGRAVVSAAQLAIVARFVDPADLGLMALVGVIVGFAQILADAGVGNAIIQKQQLSPGQLGALECVNIGVSLCLTSVIVLASPAIARLYAEPRLEGPLALAGLTLIITALSQQRRAAAIKNLAFKGLARIELLSALIGFLVAAALALRGFGIVALVAAALASSSAGTVLSWAWLPSPASLRKIDWTGLRSALDFGAFSVATNVTNSLVSDSDTLLVGRVLGAESLGFFSVPRDLSLKVSALVNPIATRVGFPLMSKAQGDLETLRRVYLETLRMTSSVNSPLYIALAVCAPEVIHVFLGPSWMQSAPTFRILAIWALFRSAANPAGSLLLAVGRADRALKWNLGLLLVIPGAVVVGAGYGIEGVATSLLVCQVLLVVPGWAVLIRPTCHAGARECLSMSLIPTALASLAGLAAWAVITPVTQPWARLTLGVGVGALVYLLLSLKFNRRWIDSMKEFVQP